MIVKLLTEHYLEFLSFKGGCRGSSESTLAKMSNCWNPMPQLKLFGPVSYDFCCQLGPCLNKCLA